MFKVDNNDVYTIIAFYSDDYEDFFVDCDDLIIDAYNANYTEAISIKDNLINGVYSTIFEKDESDTEKQKLRIKAYL